MPIVISSEDVLKHKILKALLKEYKPEENIPFDVDEKGAATGTKTIRLEISDDWKTAKFVIISNYANKLQVDVISYIFKNARIHRDFDIEDDREGIWYRTYDDAVKHIDEEKDYHTRTNPYSLFLGCGSNICVFCKEYFKYGVMPKALPYSTVPTI